MLDIRFVRENPDAVRKDLQKRGEKEKLKWLEELLTLGAEQKKLNVEAEGLRAQRNKVSMAINKLLKDGKDAAKEKKEAAGIPGKIKATETRLGEVRDRMQFILMRLPNVLHDSVPVGNENQVLREHGGKKIPEAGVQSHVDYVQEKGLADLERAAKISGARFYFLKNELVLLEQSLLRFALDTLYHKGFTLVEPPFMMQKKPYEGVTDLADFENVMYKIEGEDLYLIATSEHPLAAMHMGEIFKESDLPIKYAGISPCFRKEAGAHGKDTKGIFRVHQFNKVEQFVYSKPEDSWKLHEEILENAEDFMRRLEIPYRVVNICTGDIGTVAAKKYDIEAWFPAQKTYREVVSCSNCTGYQAARLNVKYKKADSGENEYVHTLNSTMAASPRMLVAIIENNQLADGGILIPKVLRPYMHGEERIKPRTR
ncbi:MAG: serine--tRNA ligase [Candidatus Micrarchaeota archaeon]|nr:serine--tRNA ligase [Candidatus Micrarchaeota archaeon]